MASEDSRQVYLPDGPFLLIVRTDRIVTARRLVASDTRVFQHLVRLRCLFTYILFKVSESNTSLATFA